MSSKTITIRINRLFESLFALDFILDEEDCLNEPLVMVDDFFPNSTSKPISCFISRILCSRASFSGSQ